MSKNEPAAKKLSKDEEDAELDRLMKEEEAARAAAAMAASVVEAAPPPRKPASGDVQCICLKTQLHCRMGGRSYVFKKGDEVEMHPDHAAEMEEAGWVVRRKK